MLSSNCPATLRWNDVSNPAADTDGGGPTNTVTWTKDPAYSGSWQVQTSPDLVNWMDVTGTDNGTSVSYTLPEGEGKLFVRLVVTPTP